MKYPVVTGFGVPSGAFRRSHFGAKFRPNSALLDALRERRAVNVGSLWEVTLRSAATPASKVRLPALALFAATALVPCAATHAAAARRGSELR